MYLALFRKVQKCTHKNLQFVQYIMNKNEAHEFLYTQG